jgi:hypothetical protein
MGRRRKSNTELLIEGIGTLVAFIVVIGVLAGGHGAMAATASLLMIFLFALAGVAAVVLLAWAGWRFWTSRPVELRSGSARVLYSDDPCPTPQTSTSTAFSHIPPASGGAQADGGIDLVLDPGTEPVAVQCKHWKTWQVGIKAIREFLGALTAAGMKEGIFVALGKFTPDAATLATRHGIRLVDAADLADLVRCAGVATDPDFTRALADPRKYCPKCERALMLRTATKGMNLGAQFWGCSGYPRCRFILRT